MDATCNVQDSIHVFHLVHNMCPGFWVHIKISKGFFCLSKKKKEKFFKKIFLKSCERSKRLPGLQYFQGLCI